MRSQGKGMRDNQMRRMEEMCGGEWVSPGTTASTGCSTSGSRSSERTVSAFKGRGETVRTGVGSSWCGEQQLWGALRVGLWPWQSRGIGRGVVNATLNEGSTSAAAPITLAKMKTNFMPRIRVPFA